MLFSTSFRRYHQLSRHRPHDLFGATRNTSIACASTLSRNGLHLHRKKSYLQTSFLPACFFSTPPTSTSESKDTSNPHTIPHAPVKPKVELRPGPIKPPITSQSSRAKKLPTTNSSLRPQSTSPTGTLSNSIAETMKEDLQQAYIHGVLARPPPGAGKVATFWHQVKGLFVRLQTLQTRHSDLPPSQSRNSTFEVSSWSSRIASRSERFKHE